MQIREKFLLSALCSLMLMPTHSCAFTIQDAIQQAVKTHPSIKGVKEEILMQEKILQQVDAQYYPSLDLSYSVGPEVTRTPANQHQQSSLVRQNTTITLSNNIFAGFATTYEKEQQKALILSANDQFYDSSNELAKKMSKTYLEVLKTKSLLDIAKENTQLHEKYLEQVKIRVDAGAGINSDYMQTLSRYENTKDLEYMARLQHENAIANYKSLLPEITSLEQFKTPSLKKLPAESLEDLVELAKQNYPLLHSTRSTVTAIKAEANRAKAAFYPTVDIVAQAYWNDKVHGVGYDNPLVPGTPGSKETEDAGYNALLVVNYNLYKGGSDSAFEQTKQHKLLKEQSKYLDQERSVVEGLTLSRNNFNLTTNSLQHIESYMNATGETKANYEKEHELGRRSIIDLLNISVEFNNARNRKVSAEYDRLIAYYEVLAYTGKLFEEMSISFE